MKTLIAVTAGFIAFAIAVSLLYRVFGFEYDVVPGNESLVLAFAYAIIVGFLDGLGATWLGARTDLRDSTILALLVGFYAVLTFFLSHAESAAVLGSVIASLAFVVPVGGFVAVRFRQRRARTHSNTPPAHAH